MTDMEENVNPAEVAETEVNEPVQQEMPQSITFNTKIDFLKDGYLFHDMIKESASSKHYLVEDLKDPGAEMGQPAFYYLKQTIYKDKGEYNYALDYYMKLNSYCKTPFAKTDIIRLHYIHNFDIEDNNYYEVVTIFDLGEPDRIDVDHIKEEHITRFLHNVCVLLQDLEMFDKIYHGNIYIKNIVLVGSELKLSGFKPIYTGFSEYNTWKVELVRRHGHFRGDLYLIGLIWLRFLGANLQECIKSSKTLDEVEPAVELIISELPPEKKMNIVERLLNLKGEPELTLSDVILDFETGSLVKKIEEVQKNKTSISYPQENEFNPDAFEEDVQTMMKSDSKASNPFNKPLGDSVVDTDGRGLNDSLAPTEFKTNNDLIRVQDNMTFNEDSVLPSRMSKDGTGDNRDTFAKDNKDFEDIIDEELSGKKNSQSGKISSVKNLLGSDTMDEHRPNSIRKLRSSDPLISSKREVADALSDSSPHTKGNSIKGSKASLESKSLEKASNAPKKETPNSKKSSLSEKNRSTAANGRSSPSPNSKNVKGSTAGTRQTRVKSPIPEEIEGESNDEGAVGAKNRSNATGMKSSAIKRPVSSNSKASETKPKSNLTVSRAKPTGKPKNLPTSESGKANPVASSDQGIKIEVPNTSDHLDVLLAEGPRDAILSKPQPPELDEEDFVVDHSVSKEALRSEDQGTDSHNMLTENEAELPAANEAEQDLEVGEVPQAETAEQESESHRKISDINRESKAKPMTSEQKMKEQADRKGGNRVLFNTDLEDKPTRLQILKERRAKVMSNSEPAELTDEQRMKIQRYINRELENQMSSEAKQTQRDKEMVEKKDAERRARDQALKEKLDKKSSESLARKKEEQRAALKQKIAMNEKVEQEVVEKKQQKLAEAERLAKNRDISSEMMKREPTGNYSTNGSEAIVTGLLKRNADKSPVERAEEKACKEFKISPIEKRDQLFDYNHDLESRGIAFKKFAQAPERYSNNASLPFSRSKSPRPESVQGYQSEGLSKTAGPRVTPDHFGNNEGVWEGFPSDKPFKTRSVIPDLKESPKEGANSSPSHLSKQGPFEAELKSFEGRGLLDSGIFDGRDPLLTGVKSSDQRQYQKLMAEVRWLYDSNKLEEAVNMLAEAKRLYSGPQLVGIYKALSMLFHKKADSERAKETIEDLIDLLKNDPNISNREEQLKNALLSLALLEIENGRPQEALHLLQNPVFETGPRPENFDRLLGLCLQQTGQPKAALEVYRRQLAELMSGEPGQATIKPVFQLINKQILLYSELKDFVGLASFFSKTIGFYARAKSLNSSLGVFEDEYHNFLEKVVLNLLKFASSGENYNLMNYVLREVCAKNFVDHENNMNEEERLEFFDLIDKHCTYLKSLPKYGGFKDNYIRFLDLAMDVIKNCDLNAHNLKRDLKVVFHRAVFFLEDGAYERAQKLFDKCFDVYKSFFHEPDRELYSIVYSLGHSLFKQGKFDHSEYYFAKVLDLSCVDAELKRKAIKHLARVYFRQGSFEACRDVLADFLSAHFELKNVSNYYHHLCLFFICSSKLKSPDFDEFSARIYAELADSPSAELMRYREVFTVFRNAVQSFHDFKENEKSFQMLLDVATDKNSSAMTRARKLVSVLSLLYSKLTQERKGEGMPTARRLIDSLQDRQFTLEENTEITKEFMDNFLLVFVHRLPLFKERERGHKVRVQLVDDLRKAAPKAQLSDAISELCVQAASPNPCFTLDKTAQRTAEIVAALNSDRVVRPTLTKMTSREIIERSRPDPSECFCSESFKNNEQLGELVNDFMKQLKNMLFLDVHQNIETYCHRFEKLMKEKGFQIDKYSYINHLIALHLSRSKTAPLDRLAFSKLLGQLLGEENLCVHDLKLVVLILESFTDRDYLNILVLFLDQYHSNTAKLVFQQVFFESFEEKFKDVMEQFYQRIYGFRFHKLENFPLMHLLDSHNFLNIEKEFGFEIFTRMRYEVMADTRLTRVFEKYIPREQLMGFLLQFNTYSTVVQLAKNQRQSSLQLFRAFQDELRNRVLMNSMDEISYQFFVHDLVVLLELLRFDEREQMADAIVGLIDFLESRFPPSQAYNLAVISSLAGSLLFKHKLYSPAEAMKRNSLRFLETCSSETPQPSYTKSQGLEALRVSSLSFVLMSQVYQNMSLEALKGVQQLIALEPESKESALTSYLVAAIIYHCNDRDSEGKEWADRARNVFDQEHFDSDLSDVFKATLDKVSYLISIKTSLPDEVQNLQRLSRGSILHLYRDIK